MAFRLDEKGILTVYSKKSHFTKKTSQEHPCPSVKKSLFSRYLKSSVRDPNGFTLIEMAVVVVIVGLVISMMMAVLPNLLKTSKLKQTRAILEKYDYALQGFAISHNRLPYADNNGDGEEDDGVFAGTIPYVTLGLSSGVDNHGNLVRYGVYGVAGDADNLTNSYSTQDDFCDALSNASGNAFNSAYVYTTTADACSSTGASNQAFVIASGGARNMDGSSGFFDLCNGEGTPGFNAPSKIPAKNYDDAVRAFSLGELNQKLCSGGGGSGGTGSSSTGSENTDALCSDGTDNDGDGNVDCYDQDCCGSGVTSTICGATARLWTQWPLSSPPTPLPAPIPANPATAIPLMPKAVPAVITGFLTASLPILTAWIWITGTGF